MDGSPGVEETTDRSAEMEARFTRLHVACYFVLLVAAAPIWWFGDFTTVAWRATAAGVVGGAIGGAMELAVQRSRHALWAMPAAAALAAVFLRTTPPALPREFLLFPIVLILITLIRVAVIPAARRRVAS